MIVLNLYLWLSAGIAYLTVGFFVWVGFGEEEDWWVMVVWPFVLVVFGVMWCEDRSKELFRRFRDEEKEL